MSRVCLPTFIFLISSHFFHCYLIPTRGKLYILLFVSLSCTRCMFCDVCAVRCKRDCPQTRWIFILNFHSFFVPLSFFATNLMQTIYPLVCLIELNKPSIRILRVTIFKRASPLPISFGFHFFAPFSIGF